MKIQHELPWWIPARAIADALGYDHSGINLALSTITVGTHTGYLWATEFENVYSLWEYNEAEITVYSIQYSCPEEYYYAQKPFLNDDTVWCAQRENMMEKGLRAELDAVCPTLCAL